MNDVLQTPGLAELWDALPSARLVGGVVRDNLLNQPITDIDLATPLPPAVVTAALSKAGIRSIPTGIDHGTITAILNKRSFEITTLRRDIETDGRHAIVAYTDNWQEDAARRDFTFNAMSQDRSGKLYDYFDGQTDLKVGKIRFVGDPATRLAEDYLRVLRFFRFHARFGHIPPSQAECQALSNAIPGLAKLSTERIWTETKRILATPDPTNAIALMQQLGILQAILPEATNIARLNSLISNNAPNTPILRLAALLTTTPNALATRLKLSTAELNRLQALQNLPPQTNASNTKIRQALANTPPETLIDQAWLQNRPQSLRNRLANTPPPTFPLQGRDLTSIGIQPGPEIGRLLAATRTWWWHTGCTATAEACRTELERLRAERK